MYEIVLIMRDHNGTPILDGAGNLRKKAFQTDDPGKLADFWHKNSYKQKRRSKSANKKQVKAALSEIENYIQKREKRKDKKVNPDDDKHF